MAEVARSEQGAVCDIERIMEMIPHRHPFLMIDRVVDVVGDVRATGIKNVSINEPFFQGHFPGRPVMPGVLIIEAMAQSAAVLVVYTLGPIRRVNWSISCRSTTRVSESRCSRATPFTSTFTNVISEVTFGSFGPKRRSTANWWPRRPSRRSFSTTK